jgi:putative transposase
VQQGGLPGPRQGCQRFRLRSRWKGRRGITPDGRKHILGLWIDPNEGAKFWLRIVNELRNRGVKDILIAVVDGLKGFPEAINAAFPQTLVQSCIVHLLRNALAYVSWQDRKQVVAALKPIYHAPPSRAPSPTADAARLALDAFEAGPWGQKYAAIAPLWRRQWDQVIPFFAFPPEVRRIIYTTNAIESLNSTLRTAVRSRGHFPTDEAAIKLLYLVLRRVSNNWKNPSSALPPAAQAEPWAASPNANGPPP